MADKKIIITLPRKPRKPKGGSNGVRRGPIINKKKSEYLSRRRIGGGITFYDMGRTADGTDRYFGIQPNILTPTEFPVVIQDFANTDWQTHVRDPLLAIGGNEANCHKIGYEEMDAYGMTLYVDIAEANQIIVVTGEDSLWTEAGLILDAQPEKFAIKFTSLLGYLFDTASSTVKITSSPSYAADAVTFTPSKTMQVFLTPFIANHNVSCAMPSDSNIIFGGSFFDMIPRVVFAQILAGSGFTYESVRSRMAAHPLYRTATQTSPSTSASGGTVASVPPAVSGVGGYDRSITFSQFHTETNGMPVAEGSLLAIIKKGGVTYYIWATSLNDYQFPNSVNVST